MNKAINFEAQTTNGSTINELNLNCIYVITITASVSELVINSLEPSMKVVQIGRTTAGENEFSLILVDSILEINFRSDLTSPGNLNPQNQWSLRPIVGINKNANSFSDFTPGLVRDCELKEDLSNLELLGDPLETHVALAFNQISTKNYSRSFFQLHGNETNKPYVTNR